MPPRTETTEPFSEATENGYEAHPVVANDRLMEFIMGPQWVVARTRHDHNGTSMVDRIGHFFSDPINTLRGRPILPPRSAEVTVDSAAPPPSPNDLAEPLETEEDEEGNTSAAASVPLQDIAPSRVEGADRPVIVSIPPLEDSLETPRRTRDSLQRRSLP